MTEPSAEALECARKLAFATVKEIAVALDRFVAQVASIERERCARIAEDKATCGCGNKHGSCNIDDAPLAIAAAIRAIDKPTTRED